jgi:hypothetical protein
VTRYRDEADGTRDAAEHRRPTRLLLAVCCGAHAQVSQVPRWVAQSPRAATPGGPPLHIIRLVGPEPWPSSSTPRKSLSQYHTPPAQVFFFAGCCLPLLLGYQCPERPQKPAGCFVGPSSSEYLRPRRTSRHVPRSAIPLRRRRAHTHAGWPMSPVPRNPSMARRPSTPWAKTPATPPTRSSRRST